MTAPLRLLHLEHDRNDAELVRTALEADGLACEITRVDTRPDFLAAVERGDFDLILAGHSLPAYDGLSALGLARERRPDAPFIFVSGALGEELAIESLKNGATDYVLKTRLSRLAFAVRRARREAEERAARQQAQAALRESEERLRTVLNNAPITIFALDSQGVFTLSEGKGLEQTGLKPGENVGVSALDLYASLAVALPGSETLSGLEVIRRVMAGETLTGITELRGIHFENQFVPYYDARGRVAGMIGVATVISERLQAEAALRESEGRYRLLVELSPDAVLVHSHGTLLFANAAGATMLGAAHADELTGKSLLDFIHPEHRQGQALRAGQIEQTGKPRHLEETQFVAADGRTVYAEVSAAPITYQGQAARLAVVRDISQRRQAEKELAERSRLLEAFFANTLTCIVLLDRDFNFIRVNEAYARACARDVSDFTGHNHFEFYPSQAQAIFEDVVRTRKPFRASATPFAFPDHPEWAATYWDWTLVPILDHAGQVELLVFTLNDVSERVSAEAERQKLGSAVEQTDAGVMIVNRQGVIEFVNAALERIAGRSRQDLLGQTPSVFQPGSHSKEFYAGLWGTITAGETFHAVFIDKTMEGKHVHVDQTISPIRDTQGNIIHFVSLWKDITEQVQAEKERERLFDEVQASRERMRNLTQQLIDVQEAERRRIALELHDEIGQTLTGLRLSLELPARLPVEAATARLAQARTIVDELLRYVENLALDLRPAMLDDLGLLSALLWHIERYSTRTGVRVNCKHTGLDRRFPPEIETAAFRIVQEALTNTARHAGVDNLTVRLWATPEILGLQVEDGGSGFDPEAALSAGVTSGLSGMRERALLAGGYFEIESEPGNGTRLTVELPLGRPLDKSEQPR
jgi:PAS domain S-box-containing protein